MGRVIIQPLVKRLSIEKHGDEGLEVILESLRKEVERVITDHSDRLYDDEDLLRVIVFAVKETMAPAEPDRRLYVSPHGHVLHRRIGCHNSYWTATEWDINHWRGCHKCRPDIRAARDRIKKWSTDQYNRWAEQYDQLPKKNEVL